MATWWRLPGHLAPSPLVVAIHGQPFGGIGHANPGSHKPLHVEQTRDIQRGVATVGTITMIGRPEAIAAVPGTQGGR